MEYSDLVEAIKENDSSKVNELLETLIPRLIRFLRIHMNSTQSDAEDCAQETLLHSLEAIQNDSLHSPDLILSYMLTSCRNNYLKMKEKKRANTYTEIPDSHYQAPGQLLSLIDKERQSLLEWCMQQLKQDYKNFMEYWFQHPDYEAEQVASFFNLSVSNTWTRKHRIIKQLHDCYQKKNEI